MAVAGLRATAERGRGRSRRQLEAAAAAGITVGIHTASGELAAKRLAEGFTLASVASDLTHLKAVSQAHLDAARG